MTAPVIPPPQDLDAERSILAALILGADTPALVPEAFYRTAHQQVYRAILAMRAAGTPVDVVTLSAELRKRGDLDAVGGPATLADILGYAATTSNTEHHSSIVQDAHSRRLTRDAAQRLLAASVDPAIEPASAWERLEAERETVRSASTDAREVNELAKLALSGPDFMACEFPQPRSLLGDSLLCEGGGAFLHAPGGAGKSFVGEQFSYAMASGTHWLGQFSAPADGVPVVLIQAELSSYHVQHRRRLDPVYRQSPANLFTLTYQRIGRQLDILQPADMAKIIALVKSVKARILVLDPLSQFHSEAESPEGFKRVRTAVQTIQLETGASVFLVHHEVKVTDPKNPRPSAARSRGATILTEDWAELGMALECDPSGHHRIHFDKCRHSAKPADVYVKQGENGWWNPTDPPVAIGDKTTETLERALLVCGDRGLTKKEAVEASVKGGGAKSEKAVNNALDRIARKWGFEDRQGINIGAELRPRYAYRSGSGSQVEVQTDFHIPSTDMTTDYDDNGF